MKSPHDKWLWRKSQGENVELQVGMREHKCRASTKLNSICGMSNPYQAYRILQVCNERELSPYPTSHVVPPQMMIPICPTYILLMNCVGPPRATRIPKCRTSAAKVRQASPKSCIKYSINSSKSSIFHISNFSIKCKKFNFLVGVVHL